MFPLGHLGFTLFVNRYLGLSPLFIIIGVMMPDIIDKSLFLALDVNTTRFIGHSLIFAFSAGLVIFLAKKEKIAAVSIFTGITAHLVEDSYSFIPWFYPFLEYNFPPVEQYDPLESYFSLFGFGTDLIGLAILAIMFRSDIMYFVRNPMELPQMIHSNLFQKR